MTPTVCEPAHVRDERGGQRRLADAGRSGQADRHRATRPIEQRANQRFAESRLATRDRSGERALFAAPESRQHLHPRRFGREDAALAANPAPMDSRGYYRTPRSPATRSSSFAKTISGVSRDGRARAAPHRRPRPRSLPRLSPDGTTSPTSAATKARRKSTRSRR